MEVKEIMAALRRPSGFTIVNYIPAPGEWEAVFKSDHPSDNGEACLPVVAWAVVRPDGQVFTEQWLTGVAMDADNRGKIVDPTDPALIKYRRVASPKEV